MTEETVIQPDKGLRRRVVVVVAVLLVAGFAGLGLLAWQFRDIERLADNDLAEAIARLRSLITILAWAGGLGFVGCGVWFFWLGSRIMRAGQYPPPGMKVLRPVRLRTGAAARRMTNLAFACSVILTLAGTFGMWRFWQLAIQVLEGLRAG